MKFFVLSSVSLPLPLLIIYSKCWTNRFTENNFNNFNLLIPPTPKLLINYHACPVADNVFSTESCCYSTVAGYAFFKLSIRFIISCSLL